MDRSAASSGALTAPSGPWLTRPFRGLIGRFGIALFMPVLEATLLITLLALALPVALLQVYDRILPNKATGTLVVLAGTVALSIILEALLRHVRGRLLARMAAASEVIQPTFTLTDPDGSETWSEFTTITGVPTGAILRGSDSLSEASGVWQVSTEDLRTGRVTIQAPPNSDADFTLTLRATQTDAGNGTSVGREITGTHTVNVTAVADAPTVTVADAQGAEDTPISLAGLGGALSDTDGSEILSFVLSGVPADASLSAGVRQADGSWNLTPAQLTGLTLSPPANFSGSLSLTLTAVATESSDGRPSTGTSDSFTVTIEPVNDAPELTLTAAEHAQAGLHQVEAIGIAHAQDIDSPQFGKAVITLSGAQPGDRLDLEGFTLHSESGRTMIGDTGIELVGGAYADGTGTLTLSGHAPPETYAAVLESLMLESGARSGLAAGTRSIGVVLFDGEGAASTRQSVDVIVDEAEPAESEGQGIAATGFETTQSNAGSDMILLMADEGTDMSHGTTGSWTEQIDGDHASSASDPVAALDHPPADHIQAIDDLQVDASRMSWA